MATEANNTANASNVKGVAGGYIYVAPAGTALPTDYSSALASAFENLGFISSDGIEPTDDTKTSTYTDMNGDTIFTATSSRTESFDLTFVEVRLSTLKTLYGFENVTESNGTITVKHKTVEHPNRVFVLELVLRDGRRWRRIIPAGQVTSRKEGKLVSSEMFGYETTITANAASDGSTVIDYIQSSAGGE